MKKIMIYLLCLSMLTGLGFSLSSCDGIANPNPADDGRVTVVCTNYAAYDFTRSLVDQYTLQGGDGTVEIHLLGKDGQDMHSYEPTASDIITLSSADLVVCTGAEGWLDAAVSASRNEYLTRVTMMEICDTLEGEHDHDHGDDACSLINQDEHVWLSIRNAIRITKAISRSLQNTDPDNTDVWMHSETVVIEELMDLKNEYDAT